MTNESKIIESMKHMADSATCDHDFVFVREISFGGWVGIVGRCTRCRCRYTSWPGSQCYDAIKAAKDAGRTN